MKRSKPFIAFDMDGTLLDTRQDIARAANGARSELGLAAMSIDDVVKAVGDGVNLFVSRVTFPDTHPDFSRARKIFLRHYAENVRGDTVPYPGIEDLLATLHRAGYPMGIVSNKPWNLVDELVRHFKWEKYFSVWLGGDSATQAKPAPDPLWMALERSSLSRSHPIVVIGDGSQDVMAAANAGAVCYWCAWGFNADAPTGYATIRVNSCEDILKELRKISDITG